MTSEKNVISISSAMLRQAAALARQCSSTAVRERVLVSQAAALAFRDHLRQSFGIETADGRSGAQRFVDLLDICDFGAGNWQIELRAMMTAERQALYVPTMPLMVGVLSDFYVSLQIDRELTGLEALGFARRADLAGAELSANGLFAILPVEVLLPIEQLRGGLEQKRESDAAEMRLFEEWQTRADRILRGLSEVLAADGAFGPEQIARIAAGVRDDVWRIYGNRLPESGLEPLFERLFRRFGIDSPVPSSPVSPLAFENRIEDREKFSTIERRGEFFEDVLNVGERAALYRYLLTDDSALTEHRRMRRAYDVATGGKHQTSPARRSRLRQVGERRASRAEIDAEIASSDDSSQTQPGMPPGEGHPYPPTVINNLPAPKARTMDIFEFRNRLIDDYERYVSSFIQIRDPRIGKRVTDEMRSGALWPEPLIQLNPAFERVETIEDSVSKKALHEECSRIFRTGKDQVIESSRTLRLHWHQAEAVRIAQKGHNYVLTTGTGSGKSLAYIIPIVDHVLRRGSGRGTQAIIVYPMNALANSQKGELKKYLHLGYEDGPPVTFDVYTGQEQGEERKRILNNPPDILLTNYVMLELILTRPEERDLIEAAKGLRFLVLDELHTYRGRQGADVAMLARRVRDRLDAENLQCIGTSATIAGEGSFDEQRQEVAFVASKLFGAPVEPEHIITERLSRITAEYDFTDPGVKRQLVECVIKADTWAPHVQQEKWQDFVSDPLASWIESFIGLKKDDRSGRLVRQKPRSLVSFGTAGENDQSAARILSDLTELPVDQCADAIRRRLLASYECERNPETGNPPFAFRLHQFISRGDTVYASLEEEQSRHLTLYGQRFKPYAKDHVLLPLVFCRECGQEYFSVRRQSDSENRAYFTPRQLNDQFKDDKSQAGFLHFSTESAWPLEEEAILELLPDDWIEEVKGRRRVIASRRGDLPTPVRLAGDGRESSDGLQFHFMEAPFRFCLSCGVAYGSWQKDDFSKLGTLGSEGRSTATTVTSLSVIRNLHRLPLEERARKLLSFTDNRQDASLQAGHFNDFVETTLLRAALYFAVAKVGPEGIGYEDLATRVFDALGLELKHYALDPNVKLQARKETERALREVLGYRLYRDLQRGWRITMPNLEQCGLLEIHYQTLDEGCTMEELWQPRHRALAAATPQVRQRIAKVLLDYMRRELAINVSYLDTRDQDRIKQLSRNHLDPRSHWAIDENEKMDFAKILFPRSRKPNDRELYVFLSPRGGFGQFLRRPTTFDGAELRLTLDDVATIINDLLGALREMGLVVVAAEAGRDDDVDGYQLQASAMRWIVGDGTRAFHDPIRMPRQPEGGGRTNQFFVEFYRATSGDLHGLEAREHTAQVPAEERKNREDEFRDGELPVLYCSPTMELGVDISDLNVVNLRNVPPTPANYAQRSGRAGRSGQPALVFSYCTTGSPHDQYFFKRPERMVAGQVAPPRLELANEDLVRAHVHAIWLAETGLDLGGSLKSLLDLNADNPAYPLLSEVKFKIEDEGARKRSRRRATRVLASIQDELEKAKADWYGERWLDDTINQAARAFDKTCDRWRSQFRAARAQQETQHEIVRQGLRSPADIDRARALRAQAESRIRLMTEIENPAQSDFYSYRYFASEGFLPGYSFPRLPVRAFIPARRLKQKDEYLSRPRFLAISEFGPRAIVYHEGSRYVINQVELPVGDGELDAARAKICPRCGYLHPVPENDTLNLCERCSASLTSPLTSLFRISEVSTRRRDRISADEEERMRLGYEIVTSLRFNERDGRPLYHTSEIKADDKLVARLYYGQAATIWRINLGWTRRANRDQHGFPLDIERGYWQRNEQFEEAEQEDPISPRIRRVIPYVEDTRNCLLFEPSDALPAGVMASLQAALKNAIQVRYQLEDNEIAAEPLPSAGDRRSLLLYESAEGGAGVLRRLLDDAGALASIAEEALRLCHYDPQTSEDLNHAPRAKERCEAACYDCLMSYYNQREHDLLNRHVVVEWLQLLMHAEVVTAPQPAPRAAHLVELMQQCESELERRWIRHLEARSHRLPTGAQVYIEACQTRPDFVYEERHTVIYVDGPHHDFPDRHARDRQQAEWLEDHGYTVIRFGHDSDWDAVLGKYPSVFGSKPETFLSNAPGDGRRLDLELFDAQWHALLANLSKGVEGIEIEPGEDVMHEGRVIGGYFARLTWKGNALHLVAAGEIALDQLVEVLQEQGKIALVVSPDAKAEAELEILKALGVN